MYKQIIGWRFLRVEWWPDKRWAFRHRRGYVGNHFVQCDIGHLSIDFGNLPL